VLGRSRDLQAGLLEFRFGWAEKTFSVGASIGLVMLVPEFERAVDVLGAADYACRIAKDNGRGRLQVYMDDQQMISQDRSNTSPRCHPYDQFADWIQPMIIMRSP
jgi:predicted signal transduction protein with EAL and GGDEF domain